MKNTRFYLLLIVVFVSTSIKAQFVHPGVYHKKSDLDRMKYMVESGIEPYKTSFENFSKQNASSFNYSVRKDPNDDTLARENPRHQRNQFEDDVQAARHNAIMWYITGDERHAKKAVEILNAWSSLKSFFGGGTEPLSAGLYATPLVDAAEIMKHTYEGWAAEDIQKFGDMLVYPGYSNTVIPEAAIERSRADEADGVTFYWSVYQGDPGRAGNQGLLAWRSVMAIGIFLDNEIIYERGLRQVQGMGHRSDDFAYASGPAILNGGADRDFTEYVAAFDEDDTIYTVLDDGGFVNEATVHFVDWVSGGRGTTIEDWGYDDQIQHYIWENGQCEESSRDQGHSSLGLGAVADIAEIAWNQGDDVYSYMDNRLLMGLEYTAKYNLSAIQSYPDQPEPWEPTVENGEYIRGSNRTGRREALAPNPWIAANQERNSRGEAPVTRPVYEMQTAHYNVRMGMEDEALWLNRSKEKAFELTGTYEDGDGTDAPGWGGLVFHRPEGCVGDPVSGVVSNVPTFAIPTIENLKDEGRLTVDAEGSVTIEAENYDFFSGNAEGRTYHETTPTNVGGVYRVDNETTEKTAEDFVNEGVDVKTCTGCSEEGADGYAVSDIASGEWLTYTIYIPAPGLYDLSIRYAAAKENGQIKFNFNGKDVTSDVSVPFGGDNSTSLTDWKNFTVASGVELKEGVQAIKVLFNGESSAFELNNIQIAFNSVGCKEGLPRETKLVNGIAYAFYRGSWNELPNFDELTPEAIGVSEEISFVPAVYRDYFGLVYDGYIYLAEDENYTFYMTSDDGARLSIDEVVMIENEGSDSGIELSEEICLSSGFHKIKIEYYDKDGEQELSLMYESASMEKTEVTDLYGHEVNIARYGETSQSSTDDGGFSALAIDGNTDGAYNNGSVTHTLPGVTGDESEKWWQVDLKESYDLEMIKIYNRTDSDLGARLNNFKVQVLDEDGEEVYAEDFVDSPTPLLSINLSDVEGRYVKISKTSDDALSLAEVEVYGGDPVNLDVDKVGLNDFAMTPNPVVDVLNIVYSEGAVLELHNVIGQLILTENIDEDDYDFDMSNLASGIYFMKVTRNGATVEEKLLKM